MGGGNGLAGAIAGAGVVGAETVARGVVIMPLRCIESGWVTIGASPCAVTGAADNAPKPIAMENNWVGSFIREVKTEVFIVGAQTFAMR